MLSVALAGLFLLLEFVVSLVSTAPQDVLAVTPSEERTFGVPNGVDLLEILVLAVSVVLALAVLTASLGWPLRKTSLRASWSLAVGVPVAAALVAAGVYLSFSGVLGNGVSYDEHMVQRIYLESGSLILLAAFFLSLTIAGILNWRLLVVSLVVWLAAAGVFGFLDTEPIDGLLLFPRTHLLEVPASFAAAVRGFQQVDGASSGQPSGSAATAASSRPDTSLLSEVTALQLLQPQNVPAFHVTGAVHTRYLRTATGDSYNDGTWSQLTPAGVTLEKDAPVLDALGALTEELHLPTVTPLHEFVDRIVVSPIEGVDSFAAGVLPITKNLRSVDTPATYFPYSETLAVGSRVSSYRLESALPLFALHQKIEASSAADQTYLQLPDGLPPRVHELAEQIGDTASPYLNARLLQVYLQEEYAFGAARTEVEVRQPPAGQDPVDWFLFDHRVGTSGNFSSAFVVLARAAGIPARAVSGWVITRREDTQTVHRGQMHQWAEVALDGLGWVTVDPIPRDAFTDVDINHALEAALEEMVTSAAPEVRDAAEELWADFNDPEALLLLFQGIENAPDVAARDAAQTTLSTLALDHFLVVLLDHEDPLMRAVAAYGLGVLTDPRALDALIQALDVDEAAPVRVAAARALGSLRTAWTAGRMVPFLRSDPAPEVRAEVALALGEIRNSIALRPLLDARSDDESAEVRDAAAEALARWDYPALLEVLESAEDPVQRAAAAQLMGERKYSAAPYRMVPLLGSDPAAIVRAEVALALGEIRNSVALRPLLDARSDDESAEVRAAAVEALAQWDFAALLEVLENAVDPVQRAAAAQLMGERGYADAIAPLGWALADPAEEVRDAALEALERLGAEVTRLESGGVLVQLGDEAFLAPGTTTSQATELPHIPIFTVTGAAHTGYLRTSTGDVYEDGGWRKLDPVGIPYTAGGDVSEEIWEQYTAPEGEFSTAPPERRASQSLFGFRDNPRRVVSDRIRVLPAGKFTELPQGAMPTSPDMQRADLDGVFYPFSATFASESPAASYSWTSNVSSFSQAQYTAAGAVADATYTQLPPDLSARVRELARQITGPYDSPYAKARALERYLKTQYTYRLADSSGADRPPAGRDPVEWFLFDTRQGTCGQFSSAFAVLARSVGIPARVVSGWVVSVAVGEQTVYLDQAHQWAEVALEGIGWVRFEPTAGGAPSRVPNVAPETMPAKESDTGANDQVGGTGTDGLGTGDGDGIGGTLSAADIASLAMEDEETRDAALEALEREGADVVRLETGGALVDLGDEALMAAGTTTGQAMNPPHIPIFKVTGAVHTSYLRTSTGDVYEDGGWRQLDPVGIPHTAGSDVPDEVWEHYTGQAGDFGSVPSERQASRSLFGFRDRSQRVVTNRIRVFPAGRFTVLPRGVMPTSSDLLRTDLEGVFHPFSATFVAESPATTYYWRSNVSDFSQRQYRAAAAVADATYTQLPSDLPARIRELAEEITGPHDSPYAKARALERYLSTRYTYGFANSANSGAPPPGRDPMDWFLFDYRVGTCGVFSSAFVVLARSVGIPARIVSGWAVSATGGEQTVYLDQAHQWAEVALEGIGWVGFEPTASGGAPSRVSGRATEFPSETVTNITVWPTEIRRMTPFVVGGTVLTTSGQNVSGLTVEIYINETKEHGGWKIGTTTSRSGRFEVEVELPTGLELGAYQLLARAVGNSRFYESWSDPDIKVFSGNRIELSGPAEVVLNVAAAFTGRLIEDTGRGVAGRELAVTFDGNPASSVETDASGEFTFSESFSRLGQHWVEVEIRGEEFLLDNRARIDFQVVLPTEVTVHAPASVGVGEEFLVTGELRGADGTPLAGERLIVQVSGGSGQTVQTGRDGGFQVADTMSTAGEFTVTVRFRGDGSVLASSGTVRSEALHAVTLTLEGPLRLEQGDGATFEGRLASDTFSPTGQVELAIEGAVNEQPAMANVSEGGTFEYHHPSFRSTGQHKLTGRFAGGEFVEPASVEFVFEVLAPTVMTLDGPAIVRDGDGFRLTGTLRQRDGGPVPNAAVQVVSEGPLSLTTDAEGRFAWDAQAVFDESSAHDPHESALSIDVVFEDTDQLASSRATLDVAVGLPRIVVEPLEPVARGDDAVLRGTVLLGTHPVPSAELTAGPDVAFRSNDVGAFTHPYPVSGDEPLRTTDLVIAAPALDASVTMPLVVKSASNLIVTPVDRVRPGRTALLQATLVDDTGTGIPQAALRSSQGLDAVTDEFGTAMLELAVPETDDLQGSLVAFTYAGDEVHTPVTLPYFWEGAITPAGFNWLLWVGMPSLIALAAAAAYAGRRFKLMPLSALTSWKRAPAGPVLPSDAVGEDEEGDDAGPEPQPVQLRIEFQKAAADLADVWGVDEEVRITLSVTDEEEHAITGAIVDVSVGGDTPSQLAIVGNEGAFTFSWSSAKPGEYPVSVEFGGDDEYLPSSESRILRIVDFREEIVRLYNVFLDWAKDRAEGVTEQSTPREVEVLLVSQGLPVPQKALDELISRFEEADYSEHPIARRHYEAMYRAWSAVVEAER